MSHNLPLNERIIHTMTTGTINDVGIALLAKLIHAQRPLEDEAWKALNPTLDRPFVPSLPGEWDYRPQVTTGEYRGSFAKRVRAYYFKVYGLKCPESFIAQVGTIASAHTNSPDMYTFDFVDEFDWRAGDFGDDGSCYWSYNAGARVMLRDNGGLAMRFFAGGWGYARAWVVPQDDFYVVYNGYGFVGDETLKAAQIFADYARLPYKRITLTNQGGSYGTLYINSGRGYLVGSAQRIAGIETYDFGWEITRRTACYDCGDITDQDDSHIGADGETYCQECFYGRFEYCASCGEAHYHDDLTYTVDGDLCDGCAGDYDQCPNCFAWVQAEDIEDEKCGQCRGG